MWPAPAWGQLVDLSSSSVTCIHSLLRLRNCPEHIYRAYISSISGLYKNFINGPIKHIYCNDHWPSLSASRSCSLSPSPSPAPALSRNFIFYLRWAPTSALAQARSRIYIFIWDECGFWTWRPSTHLTFLFWLLLKLADIRKIFSWTRLERSEPPWSTLYLHIYYWLYWYLCS